MATPTLDRITVYPVKSLGPHELETATLVENGALARDREYALFDADGNYVNGKRNRDVHRLDSSVDFDAGTIRLSAPGRDPATFDLDTDGEAMTTWLESHFGEPVELRRDQSGGFPDDTVASGPTVISTATVREVASWFPGIDADEMRRRLRPNLEVGGVPAFWEDHLFADRESVVAFDVGGVRIEGVNPCQRCVVPTRDPDTGEEYDGFRETFVERREETLPDWSGGDWFDHHFRLMVNTRVPESEWGKTVSVGDETTAVGCREF